MYKKIIIGAVALVILGVAYYGVSPLFINVRIDEVAPQPKEASSMSAETNLQITTEGSAIVGTARHPASGSVRVINTENGAVLRYENFKTVNGPDLYVYLAKDLDAKEFINLGLLKATEGNINYDVPPGTNINDYRYAMVWCKAFGVLFNYADISENFKQQ